MGRPVPRQLMRNELLDLTTIVPATACHCGSCAERYSRFISGKEIFDLPMIGFEQSNGIARVLWLLVPVYHGMLSL